MMSVTTEKNIPQPAAVRRKLPDQERENLVLEMLPQVKYRAIQIYNQINRTVELPELISAGLLGLMDAVDRFDENRGVKFQTYADLRIEGAIKDALRKMDWASRSHRQKKKLYESTYIMLRDRLGRSPTDEDMARELNMEPEQWRRFLSDIMVVHVGTFTEIQSDDGESSEIRYIPDDSETNDPHYLFEKKELVALLADEIQALNKKEALVLSLYYYEELNMKEIGLILGVTESRISQIHNQAVMHLKYRMRAVGRKNRPAGPGRS